MPITLEAYVNHYKQNYPDVAVDEASEVTPTMFNSARSLITSVNLFLKSWGGETHITSGWRPRAVNALIPNAASRSKHMTMQAVDLLDPEGLLDEFCLASPDLLSSCSLWFEHPSATKGWCHLQNAPYGSYRSVGGKPRWFYP